MKYAYVLINNITVKLDKPFLYYFNESLNLEVGDCVQVPFGFKNEKSDAFVMSIYDEILENDLKYKDNLKEIKNIIFKNAFTKKDIETIKFIRNKYLSSFVDALRLFIPRGSLKGKGFKTKRVVNIKNLPKGKYEKYQDIFTYIDRSEKALTRAEIQDAGFSLSSINTLIKHDFLELVEEKDFRYSKKKFEDYPKPKLNEEQTKALEILEESETTVSLLHGITGSGKTEVFMQLIENHIKKGENAVVLVPEISLTPQMTERFKGRFRNEVTIYHSRMSDGERFDEWMRVKNKEVKIAIGARSALFLPFDNLKVVIIDEEHESSYKSETNPKYRTDEVAEFMMNQNDGKVILSSATPRMETFYKVRNGDYTRAILNKRATNMKLPKFEVVDMREELKLGNRSIISNRLKELIEDRLNKKEQVILFLNRRGYSNFVSCRKCGFVYKCPNCSVSLTLHQNNQLTCHHCGYTEKMRETCPSCGSSLIKKFGAGTEQVENIVKSMFKDAKVLRMDKDTTRFKDSFDEIYETFKQGDADILIGTQMLAKGLDFDRVSLVGILSADMSLNIPDFRSYEKTFSLITQVSGRAGRRCEDSIVVLQGYDIDNYAIKSAIKGAYTEFYDEEIKNRELFNYPPTEDLFSIVLSGENEEELKNTINKLSIILRKNLKKYNIIILGPNPSLISKLKSLYRYQLILKGKIDSKLGMSIRKLVYDETLSKNIRVSLDVSPEYLL